ncbi:MAG: hypothetical protein ACYDAN_07370 [Candidatus Limnocylindrales bacterium]
MRSPHRRHGPAFAFLVAALLIAAGCGSSAATTPPSPAGPHDVPATAAPASGSPSTTRLITAAERAGRLDHDTALLYQAYAALDYGSLPAEYQSDNPATPDATRILAELRLRSAQLAPEVQAKVAPFFMRPSDPASVWARLHPVAASGGGSVSLAAYSAADCPASTATAGCVDAQDTQVRVWYPRSPELEATAAALAREIDTSGMWAKERTAMLDHVPCTDAVSPPFQDNGGDGRLDIYLVPTATGTSGLDFGGRRNRGVSLQLPDRSTANGVTVVDRTDGCGAIPFIVLNASRATEDLAGTTAHELFHAFQFSFRNALESDRSWWAEASATWARDLVYPKSNDEQAYLDGFWSRAPGPEGPLDQFAYGSGAPYAAYLWPFYLRQALASTNGSIVGRIWKASESEDPIHVMGALDNWARMFKEFALWNWNADDPSLMRYKDQPDGAIPSTVLTQLTWCMTGDGCEQNADGSSRSILAVGTHTVSIDARYASVQYLAGSPEVDVQALRFDLREVQGKPGLGIQAIIWTGASPSTVKEEDWSSLSERRFCLASEDVRKIVLVVSNSAVDPVGNVTGSIKVDATDAGCPTTTRSTATYTKDASGANRTRQSKLSMVVVSSEGKTTATVDYHFVSVETTASGVIRETADGSGTVDADIRCHMAPDGTVTVETSWTEEIPAVRSRTYDGAGTPEQSALEFHGFIFTASGDPARPGTSGTKTEDDSTAEGSDIAVYTWDCPAPDRGP